MTVLMSLTLYPSRGHQSAYQITSTSINAFSAARTNTTAVLRPFVLDYTGEPVPEETLTHPPS